MIVRTAGLAAVGAGAQQAIGAGYSVGSAALTPVVAHALVTATGIAAGLALPIVGAAFAGIFLGIEALLNSGCGQSCIVTSNWANQAEALLKQNLAAYMALPTPRAESAQAAYLENFDKVWAYLVQECSSPGLSTAGRNCIADRQAGACKWRSSNGQCFNWFSGYRDPIANDPNVVPDSAASMATGAFIGVASSLGISPWLVAGAALVLIGLGAMAS